MRALILGLMATTMPICVAVSAQPAPAVQSASAKAFDQRIQAVKEAMMADPGRALTLARQAQAAAGGLGDARAQAIGKATAQWLEAEALIGVNRPKDAGPIATQALKAVEIYAPRTKLHGDLLRSLAGIAALDSRVQDALKLYQQAHDIFRAAGERRSRAIVLQDIGSIYWEAGDYPRVLDYFRQSEEVFADDPALLMTMRNNRAEVLRTMGRHVEAERDYLAALKDARAFESPTLEARILTNLAVAQARAGKLDAAERSARSGLRLARGDAAEWRPFLVGALAEVAALRGANASAVNLLDQVFSGIDFAKTSMAYRELHQLAATVYERAGQHPLAFEHLKAFQRLDREAQGLIASSASQLLAARFDSANQKARIASLKQGQLERDIRIERQQARFRTILFSGLAIAGLIVLSLLLVSALRIRRSRNEVRAANTVLTQVNAKLEKALQAKTEFLAMTSHEIRTPLNGILGMTQILLANRAIDSEVREQVQVVHGAGENMRALVDDILDVAKMETGQVEVAAQDFSLRKMLEDTTRLWRGHAIAKGLDLSIDIDGAPAMIRSDEARIRQIVGNLLSNAVKFTSSGTVRLHAWAEAESQLMIEVQDTGIGIAEENHDRIFESFQQVDGGVTRQFAGTGLGLAICRNLATALGGTISVQSEAGMGSTFTLSIPYEPTEAQPAVERSPELYKCRLLLVEANAMTEGKMRALLDPCVASIDCAPDAPSAIDVISSGRADHVLVEGKSATSSDQLPLDALRSIIGAAQRAEVPCSVLFAPSDDLPIEDVAQLGAARLMIKPIGGSAVVVALQEAHAEAFAEPPAQSEKVQVRAA